MAKQELEILNIPEVIRRNEPDQRMVGRNRISLMKFKNPIPDQTQKGPWDDPLLFFWDLDIESERPTCLIQLKLKLNNIYR